MTDEGIFADEWRDCLRAHYMHVVRTDDRVTLRSLVDVMAQVGFTEDDLKALYLRATLRADDVVADFVPDFNFLAAKPEPSPEPPAVSEPASAVEMVLEMVDELLEERDDKAPSPPADPVQLSLF